MRLKTVPGEGEKAVNCTVSCILLAYASQNTVRVSEQFVIWTFQQGYTRVAGKSIMFSGFS